MLTVQEFIRKWRASALSESSAAQSHFNDLCEILGEPKPADADPEGTWFTFEKGAKKSGGGDGWADVWKRGHFAWEYKGKGKNLEAANKQLLFYAGALQNPPLLIVSDMETFIIRTNFTNSIQEEYRLTLDDLEDPRKRQILKWAFSDPERLRPGTTTLAITEAAAGDFADIAQRLREAGHEPHRVAHFLNKILFCLFAEDTGLLPRSLFTRLLENCTRRPERFEPQVRALFAAMAKGDDFGVDEINWFNGGLFDGDNTLPVLEADVRRLLKASQLDWSNIEPSIFGTLFERGLDPSKRSQLGAHYTDTNSIMRLVNPVVVEPLRAEWEREKAKVAGLLEGTPTSAKKKKAADIYHGFLDRLSRFRVLDPACGSGNFLYLALQALKDMESVVHAEAEQLGLQRNLSVSVGPECVMGIELNPYAAELARVTVWIGEIQWTLRHGAQYQRRPILRDTGQIENRDAVMNADGREAEWPEADCIIGNPPFLGDKKMISEMGEEYVSRLRELYKGRVPGGADLVTYWYEKARAMIESGKAKRAGLVATNSIRGGASRKVLDRIRESGEIFNAWSDEPWINEGAAVRVSLVSFANKGESPVLQLNGQAVEEIYADLTGRENGKEKGLDFSQAVILKENDGVCFHGMMKGGAFDISGELAREWLLQPNPHGLSNKNVLKPSLNGQDITQNKRDAWIIDFGVRMNETEAALFEMPFNHVLKNVKPVREKVRREGHKKYWWRFGEARPGLRAAVSTLPRYITTPEVSKHRVFVFVPVAVIPDHKLVIFSRADDTFFGILHSRIHELWTLAKCSWMGVGNDPVYSSEAVFRTFPSPEGLTPNIPAADYADDPRAVRIAEAAKRLNELREHWLNPPEWVKRVPEVVPGYPDRILPVDEAAAKELKKRTLTNLYNQRPAWLVNAHRELDEAVAAAYGWQADLTDEEILRLLLELNKERG